MKKIYALFLLIIMAISFSLPVFAQATIIDPNKEYEQEPPIYTEFNGELDMDNIQISEETGFVNISINVVKNRPVGFNGYDFSISFLDLDTGLEYFTDVKASNDYKLKYELPYGNYMVVSGRVKGDSKGDFQIISVNGNEFTVSEKDADIVFEFYGIQGITGEEVETVELENIPERDNNNSSEIIKVLGIFMVILAVVISFCLFFLVSMKKYKNNN